MMTGFLIAYTAFTLPVVSYIGYKVWRKMRHPESELRSKTDTQTIIEVVRACRDVGISWLTNIAVSQDSLKRDNQAMLQATKAIAQSLLDIKSAAESFTTKAPSPEKSINDFVHSLEYARDRFARTATQKKVVQAIISNVKLTHGTESK